MIETSLLQSLIFQSLILKVFNHAEEEIKVHFWRSIVISRILLALDLSNLGNFEPCVWGKVK